MTANSTLLNLSNQSSAKKNKVGFTLIELMVAIAILAILATVGIVMYGTAQKAVRSSKRAQDLDALKTALELYKNATGYYPSHTAANTFVCITTPLNAANFTPTYMPILPADPLDGSNPGGSNCYQYASSGTSNSTDYKLRTNISIYGSSGEMNSAAFLKQPGLIDPDRDGTPNDDCAIQTGGTIKGWAVHSGNGAMCNQDTSE